MKTSPITSIVVLIFAILAGIAAFSNQLLGLSVFAPSWSTLVAMLILGLAFYGFISCGGPAMTASSVFFLAFALNLGFPAAYTAVTRGHQEYDLAVGVGLLCAVIAFLVALKAKKLDAFQPLNAKPLRVRILPVLVLLVLLNLAFLGLFLFDPILRGMWRHTLPVFPAAFALVAYYGYYRRLFGQCMLAGFLALVSLLSWSETAFSGYGRLNILAIFLAPLIIVSIYHRSWIYKFALVIASPLALAWAGLRESGRSGRTMGLFAGMEVSVQDGLQVFETGSGLGSILAPYNTLVEIVARSSLSGMRPAAEWLEQAMFFFLYWVPRGWWPDKPAGFGTVLAYDFRPQYAVTGHTMAASNFGEVVYYFGLIGMPIAILLTIGLTRALNSFQVMFLSIRTRNGLVFVALASYVVAQLMTFVWGGFAAFAPRALSPLFGIVGLFSVWLLVFSMSPRKQL